MASTEYVLSVPSMYDVRNMYACNNISAVSNRTFFLFYAIGESNYDMVVSLSKRGRVKYV